MLNKLNTGSLKDLADLPGMPSERSLRNLIARWPEFPIIERGKSGRSYVFDLPIAAAFVRSNWRGGRLPDDPGVQQLALFDDPAVTNS